MRQTLRVKQVSIKWAYLLQVAAVLAEGTREMAEAGRQADAVAVQALLYRQDRLDLLAAMLAALAGQHQGPQCAALLFQHAHMSGR